MLRGNVTGTADSSDMHPYPNFNYHNQPGGVTQGHFATHSMKLMSMGPQQNSNFPAASHHHIMSTLEEESMRQHQITQQWTQKAGDSTYLVQQQTDFDRLNAVSTSNIGGSMIGGQSSSSSLLMPVSGGQGALQPTKPTHRRKKSQQPTLMSTKQKQSTNQAQGGTSVISATQRSVGEGSLPSNRERILQGLEEETSGCVGDQSAAILHSNRDHHLREGIFEIQPGADPKPAKGQQQHNEDRNLRQGGMIHQTQGNSNLKKAPESSSHQQKPMSPSFQGFAALNLIIDRVHQIGFVDQQQPSGQGIQIKSDSQSQLISNQTKKPQGPGIQGFGVGSSSSTDQLQVVGLLPNSVLKQSQQAANNQNSSEKMNKVKKQHPNLAAASQQPIPNTTDIAKNRTSQFAVQILYNQQPQLSAGSRVQSQVVGASNSFKKGAIAKGGAAHYPIGSGLFQMKQGGAHLPVGGSDMVQKNSAARHQATRASQHQMRMNESQNERIRYPEALAQVGQTLQKPQFQVNQSNKIGDISNSVRAQGGQKDIIKQLMTKHFAAAPSAAPTIDSKAAYLRHVEGSSGMRKTAANNIQSHEQQKFSIVSEPIQPPRLSKHEPGKSIITIKDEVSPTRSSILGNTGKQCNNQSKRVTFNAPSSHDQSEEAAEDEEATSQMLLGSIIDTTSGLFGPPEGRKRSNHRRSNYSINPQKKVNIGGDHKQLDQKFDFQNHHQMQAEGILEEGENEMIHTFENQNSEEQSTQQEPTVVIDSSVEENVNSQYQRMIDDNNQNTGTGLVLHSGEGNSNLGAHHHPKAQSLLALDNIQAALMSIRQQQEEEEEKQRVPSDEGTSKPAAIMTQEEEEALINQINEIRDRIRRGETVAQQRGGHAKSNTIDYDEMEEEAAYRSAGLLDRQMVTEYGSISQKYSAEQPVRPPFFGGSEMLAIKEVGKQTGDYGGISQNNNGKPLSNVAGHARQKSFYSIDSSSGQGNFMIVTDGPNIYEKKRQRFEKIQRLRGATTASATIVSGDAGPYGTSAPQDHDGVTSRHNASREGTTHNAGDNSSCVSGNYASLIKNVQKQNSQQKKVTQNVISTQQARQGKKQSSQSKSKSISAKTAQKQQINKLKRVTTSSGKSRQNSTVDQIIASHSQQYRPTKVYHSSSKSGCFPTTSGGGLLKGGNRSSSSGRKERPGAHSHITLDPDSGNSRSYTGLPDSQAFVPNTYRGGAPQNYDEEEMQIQLFSLKKIIPGAANQRGGSTTEKARNASKKKQASNLKRKPNPSTNKGSVVVSQASQNPSSLSHIKEKSIMLGMPGQFHHVKNNRSNLMINISEMPTSQTQMAQSLSLKRLKTPKIKLKEELTTPPIERSSQQTTTNQPSSQSHQQRVSQFQSVQNPLKGFTSVLPGSTKNQQQHTLNYHAVGTSTHGHHKSPFIYAQTSKHSNPLQPGLSNQPENFKIIESRLKSTSQTHSKQKSVHAAPQQQQQPNSGSLPTKHNSRGGSVGGPHFQMQQQVPPTQLKMLTLEPKAVQTLINIKKETDQALESLKRKLSESRSFKPPQMIQPTKNVSTVTSGTTSAQQLPTSHTQTLAALQQQQQTAGRWNGQHNSSNRQQCSPHDGERESTTPEVNQQLSAISEFEKNYRKLSCLIDKMFN